ncbi:MAG: uncharacterized protein H6Q89_1780 [Myxococcaceae bacterium]|nr:uncharacterized protein [Myxococcaceae bacterium]
MISAWLVGYLFTQAIEVPLYLRVTRLKVAVLASTLTHPIVWFVFPAVWPGGYVSMLIAAELFAWGAEARWLQRHGVHRAALWSFIANGASFCIGLALRRSFGIP